MKIFSNKELIELKRDIEKDGDYSPITWITEYKDSLLIFTADSVYKSIEKEK